MSVVDDNRMKTGMIFAEILKGNQPPKSVIRVNPFISDHKKPMIQKKQAARFTLAWLKPYLNICAMYYT